APRSTIAFTTDAAGGQLGQMAGAALSMVGYKTVELYGESDATFDPKTDTTVYKKYNFGLTDGFDVQVNGGLQGLKTALSSLMASMAASSTPADPNAPPKVPDMSGLQQLKIVNLDLTLTDKSIMEKVFQLAPMMGGSDPAHMRNDIVQMLTAMG